jgi:hypothetical protein
VLRADFVAVMLTTALPFASTIAAKSGRSWRGPLGACVVCVVSVLVDCAVAVVEAGGRVRVRGRVRLVGGNRFRDLVASGAKREQRGCERRQKGESGSHGHLSMRNSAGAVAARKSLSNRRDWGGESSAA